MFNWLYKKIVDNIIKHMKASFSDEIISLKDEVGDSVIQSIQTWLSEEENIKQLTGLVDNLFDRELKRAIQQISGAQKGMVQQGEGFDVTSLFNSRGGFSSKKLLGMALQSILSGGFTGGQAPTGQAIQGKRPYDY